MPIENHSESVEESSPSFHPRNPWIAGLLATFCWGLGHLYCGRLKEGLLFMFLPKAIQVGVLSVVVLAGAPSVVITFWVLFMLVGVVSIWQVVLAVMIARRASPDYELRPYNRRIVYAGMIVAFLILSETGIRKVIDVYKIPSGSMLPGLMVGDQILVKKLGDRNRTPQRGDVVAFRAPAPSEVIYAKRVVGISGDKIEERDGVIFVNGQPMSRTRQGVQTFLSRDSSGSLGDLEVVLYEEVIGNKRVQIAQDLNQSDEGRPGFEPVVVPGGHFFVMGDNRDHAYDSRWVGTIPLENLIGRVDSISWSWNSDGIRLDRMGRRF